MVGPQLPSATGAGVTVHAGAASAITDPIGQYVISDLPGGSYTFTPKKSGYSFNPPSRAVALQGQKAGHENFEAEEH